MQEYVQQIMLSHGDRAKIVPIHRLQDLKRDIDAYKSSPCFTEVTNNIVNNFYRFDLPDAGIKINSIIVAASPSRLVTVLFNWKSKKIPAMIPPGYIDNVTKPNMIEQYLNGCLNPKGYHVKQAPSLPQKLLTARSGLGVYGRNNIAYVEGMGSLLLLSTYYSDLQSEETCWHDTNPMDFCGHCMACLHSCPTSALTEDRYPVIVERCLTYLNEFVGAGEFPDWLDSSAHNCIQGCTRCQTCCPKNKDYLDTLAIPVEFSEEETLLLLQGNTITDLPAPLKTKIMELNLTDYLDLLPRNLKVLLDK